MLKHQMAIKVHSPEPIATTTHDTEQKTSDNSQLQDVTSANGTYSDSTENYDYNKINTSSDTVLYNIDTETHAQMDSNRDTPGQS